MAVPKEERTVEIIVNGQRAFASLKEMDAAAAVLYNQFRKLSADDPGRGKLLADLQEMRQRITKVKQEVNGVSETTGVMKQAFANAFALFTGGGLLGLAQKLFGFFADSRQEALASAKSSADLDATLRSTAHAAGLTAAEIRKIGEERAKVTLFDDDETNHASAMLLTFTNIKKGVFEDAIPAIQDLATKMGGDGPADMKGASIQVGKALNDPIKGITALTRVGVTFTEQQKEQITQMVKAGNTAGAQKLILAELNKEFGGSAEAARKAAGGVATLSLWFGEFKETVGGQVNVVLDKLSQWLGRVFDKAQPLLDMVGGIVDMFAEFYHEIGDILISLGLFSEKTDTAAIFVEVLKMALTLLLLPIKATVLAVKGLVDVFIDWYNKSELLRGVLGGLGALVVSVFTTIKDGALKILGGVGDIIVGIFSLDKNKIIAGFKSALSATADVALESGHKAAEAFKKGYEANKDNHITRTVRVKTQQEEPREQVELGKTETAPTGESEKDKKARLGKLQKLQDAADQARLDALKELVKQEEALEDARVQTIADKREREIAQLNLDATRKARLVTGSEREQAEQLTGIVAERDRKLQELAEKYQKEAEAQRKEDFEHNMAEEDAAEQERAAKFQERFQDGLDSEARYHEKVYDSKRAALQAELELEEAYAGKISKQYTKTAAELLKLEKDRNKQVVDDARKAQKAKAEIAKLELSTASDVLATTLDLLFQDEVARRQNHDVYVALAAAKIIVDGTKEVQAIWQYSAEQPENSFTAGVFGTVLAGIQTGLAVARTAVALGKLGGISGGSDGGGSYAQGGATGRGDYLAVSPMGLLLQMSGMQVGSSGRLFDGSGFAVAGVVHEDEYVIPKWQLADPQVAAVAQWLEARRLRGFADGGHTTANSGATLPVAAASPAIDGEKSYAVQTQMLDALLGLREQLADVKQWQRELQVRLDLRAAQNKLDEYEQVKQASAIRSKS